LFLPAAKFFQIETLTNIIHKRMSSLALLLSTHWPDFLLPFLPSRRCMGRRQQILPRGQGSDRCHARCAHRVESPEMRKEVVSHENRGVIFHRKRSQLFYSAPHHHRASGLKKGFPVCRLARHGMPPCPIPSGFDGVFFVVLPVLRNVVGERVIGVGSAEQCLKTEEHRADAQSRAPFVL